MRTILFGGLALLIMGLVFQSCAETKTYNLAEKSDQTASLMYPDSIQIDRLDFESVEGLFSQILYGGNREIIFAPGSHTVTLRYNTDWDIDDDDHEKIVSSYITLQFNAVSGNRYRVAFQKPETRSAAWDLATHFKADIVNDKTGAIVSRPVP